MRVTGCDGWVAGERAGVRVIEPFHLRELVLLHNAAVIKRMSLFLSCRVVQAHPYGVKNGCSGRAVRSLCML